MKIQAHTTDADFAADFPIDFGKGVRGSVVRYRNKKAGIILAHRTSDGAVCVGSVFWIKVNNGYTFTKSNDDPLTIEESIRCTCGLHGWIREGEWSHAHDSIQ